MKKILSILVILVALGSLAALQSCKDETSVKQKEFFAFSDPVVVAPADGATIDITGTTADITWQSTSESGSPVKADVYFGTSEEPELYKAGHTATTLTVPVEKGITYYWHVDMIDVNGIHTYGPTWSFTIFEPIGIYVGDFLCDEPAEAYSYDVSFDKTSDNTLHTGNYWNSGWDATFTLDFANKTYTMPTTSWVGGTWSAEEAGTIDPETGTMVGDYTITHNGAVYETGTHTYTKY
jgi:hypothetical protein